MQKLFRRALMASTMLAGLVASAGAQELVTADRVGSPDAPNVLTVRTNDDFSPNSPFPDQRAGFVELFQMFAEEHPDWQLQFEYFSDDIGGEHFGGGTCTGHPTMAHLQPDEAGISAQVSPQRLGALQQRPDHRWRVSGAVECRVAGRFEPRS